MFLEKYISRLTLIVLSILMSLVVCELSIKLYKNVANEKNNVLSSSNIFNRDKELVVRQVKEKRINSKTFNIYYFGESTMKGEPYLDTIPLLVEKMLNGKINGKQIKWINMGDWGISYKIVSGKIKMIVDNKETFHPNLVIIYSGHNEFLPYHSDFGFTISDSKNQPINWLVSKSQIAEMVAQNLKSYKLEIDERKFFDKPLFDNQKYADVINNYQKDINIDVDYLKKNNIPTIISTVAGNYADLEPNRSVYDCNESRKEEFKNDMDNGLKAENENKLDEALKLDSKALEICSTFAETQYRLGKVYEKLGRYDEAWEAFNKAVDNDKMPIRAQSSQNEFIKKIEENDSFKVVDAVEYLRNSSPNKLIGYNLMSDGHHPNITGHRLISEMFAKKIVEMYPKDTDFTEVTQTQAEEIFSKDTMVMLVDRAEWLYRIGTWTYNPTERLNKADEYLDQAAKLHPDWVITYLEKMIVMYLRKDTKNAEIYYEKAKELNPIATSKYMNNPWVSQIIYRSLSEK